MSAWNFDELSSAVSKVAPLLGSAISLSNPLAGVVISLISQAFGADKNDPNSILNKINLDPEAALKLKKIEFDHQESLEKIRSDDYKTEVDDRKSARDFQEKVYSFIPTFLAVGYFLTYSVIQLYCLEYPAQTNDIISARLHDGFMIILSYFFGRNHRESTQST